MKLNETVMSNPTLGFNVEEVQFENLKFTIWDVGGQKRIRFVLTSSFLNYLFSSVNFGYDYYIMLLTIISSYSIFLPYPLFRIITMKEFML